MTIKGVQVLSYKDLCQRWGASKDAVKRDVRKFGLCAFHFIGRVPFFAEHHVLKMEARRVELRSKQLGLCLERGNK